MEWVETTGRTVDAALDAALDQLGVDEDEVEFEVIQEPRTGLLGRRDARIRARVRPVSREKPGERRRRPPRRPARAGGRGNGASQPRRSGNRRDDAASREPAAEASLGAADDAGGGGRDESGGTVAGTAPRRRRRSRGGRGRRPAAAGGASNGGRPGHEGAEERTVAEDSVSVEEQAEEAADFTRGFVEALAVDAEVSTRREDDDVVIVDIDGPDLGLLVGPKGATLQAIEELVRTVVQRRTEGHGARIHVDVSGYRAKRRAALERFALDLAAQVRESGEDRALEPMSASDRKVVHDAVATLDGVTTTSEGEEPRRRVVVRPG
jgi:spoIIIJ-associated protein